MTVNDDRKALALEILLTSGLLTYRDLQNGMFSQGPRGVPELAPVILAVLIGGVNGASKDEMLAAAQDPEMVEAVNAILWTAVAQLIADHAEVSDGA